MNAATTTVDGATTDDSLVIAAANGDHDAFATLYDRYANKVYNLVLRSARDAHAAQDICQETWTKAYRELPRLREPAAFSGWLYRIASRLCVDRARKRSADPATTQLVFDVASDDRDDPESSAVRADQARLAWEALGALPVRQHLALYLREVEGKSYQEIARDLDTSHSAVETLLFRARRGLAVAYERLEGTATARCGQAEQTMATVLDGEGTPVQRQAVESHVDACSNCRTGLRRMRRASAAYGLIPLVAAPHLLDGVVGAAAAGGSAAGASTLSHVLGLVTTKAKLAAVTATITTGLATTALVFPGGGAHVVPPTSAVVEDAPSQESVASTSDRVSDSSVPADDAPVGAEVTPSLLERLWGAEDIADLSDAPTLGPTLDSIVDQTSTAIEDTLDDATEALDGVLEDTTQALDDIVNDTTGAVDDTLENTTGTLDDALEDTTGTLDELQSTPLPLPEPTTTDLGLPEAPDLLEPTETPELLSEPLLPGLP